MNLGTRQRRFLHMEADPSEELCGWALGQYQNDVDNVLGGGK